MILDMLFFFILKQGRGLIKVSPEVSEALSNGGPVVALESTIISHGKTSILLCFLLKDYMESSLPFFSNFVNPILHVWFL